MPLLRQGKQVLREKRDFLDVYCQLTGARAEQISAGADVVAKVQEFVEFESLVADGVFLDVDLHPLSALLQMREGCLAHQAHGHDATRHTHLDSVLFEFFAGLAGVLFENLGNGVGVVVATRIRLLPKSLDLCKLLSAKFVDVLVESQMESLVLVFRQRCPLTGKPARQEEKQRL